MNREDNWERGAATLGSNIHVPPTTSALQIHLCPLPSTLGAVYFALCTLYFVLVHFPNGPEREARTEKGGFDSEISRTKENPPGADVQSLVQSW